MQVLQAKPDNVEDTEFMEAIYAAVLGIVWTTY